MCRHISDPFFQQMVSLLENTRYPAAILDEQFLVVWAGAEIQQFFPALAMSDGVHHLLDIQNTELLISQIQQAGSVCLPLCSVPLAFQQITLSALSGGSRPFYLLTPVMGTLSAENTGTGLHPEGSARMLSTFSSQYRTPLTMIFSMISALKQNLSLNLSPDAQTAACGYLQVIWQNSLRILRSCEWVSVYAQLMMNPTAEKRTSIELRHWLDQFLKSAKDVMAESGVPLEYTLPKEPVCTACDLEKLSNVLLNLLSNSLRFTRPENAVHIKVSLSGMRLLFNICDQGIGIPYEVQPRVFEPYFSYAYDNTPFPGNGLGLAIVQLSVRALGGSVTLTSEPQKGTMVSFTIKLHPVTSEPPSAESLLPEYLATDRLSTLRVALADSLPPYRF